jgi:predicted HTH domain antitoxin
MVVYFWDSNAISKIYHPEIGAKVVTKLFEDKDSLHSISRLSTLEVPSIFAKMLRSKIIEAHDFELLYRRFWTDIKQKRWRVLKFQSVYFHSARLLLWKYGGRYALRTLDSLQLAASLFLQDKMAITNFISSAKVLNNIVRMEGIPVLDPEEVEEQQKRVEQQGI